MPGMEEGIKGLTQCSSTSQGGQIEQMFVSVVTAVLPANLSKI